MHFSPLSGASRQRPLPASDAKKRPFSQALRRDCIGKDGLYKIFVIENFSAVAPDCQKSPDRTTCAYGRDTDREIERRECARPVWAECAVLRLILSKRDCTAEARPADETAEAEQGQPSKFASGLRPALQIWVTATK